MHTTESKQPQKLPGNPQQNNSKVQVLKQGLVCSETAAEGAACPGQGKAAQGASKPPRKPIRASGGSLLPLFINLGVFSRQK